MTPLYAGGAIVTNQAAPPAIPRKDGELPTTFGTPPVKAVLVHQPGKVGSSSVYRSMHHSLPVPAFQTHIMNRKHPKLSDEGVDQFETDTSVPIHIQKVRRFIHRFQRKNKPFACVTLIRDPIARNVSAFFQNLDWYEGLADMSAPPPVERYLEVFLNEWDHEFADKWFDFHLRDALGVDWFAGGFDPAVGHAARVHGKNTFLLMHLELDDATKEQIIRDFLNFQGFRLDKSANIGEQKAYAEIYRAFRALRLPSAYLDRMCDTKVATRLYAPEHMARFRAKWEC
ncbi:MAG: putative capsular polysaccharide synthesis family protein [Planctomycetota bacterium]